MSNLTNNYAWIDFYSEFADKLVPYAEKRSELIEIIKEVYKEIGINIPKLENNKDVVDIDPFTVYGLFNKGIKHENRLKIISAFRKKLGISASVPKVFDGVPVLNNQKATYYYFQGMRGDDDIENLWKVFLYALNYADNKDNRSEFVKFFDLCKEQKGVRWNLTMGLFWIRPNTYINLDSSNRQFIQNPGNTSENFVKELPKFGKVPSGEEYLKLCEKAIELITNGNVEYHNLPELSNAAWNSDNSMTPNINALSDVESSKKLYWLYYIKDEEFWNSCCKEKGRIAFAWKLLGNLREYKKCEMLKKAMQEKYEGSGTHQKRASMLWRFSHEIKTGDVIYVKCGNNLVGKGNVTSEYIYDSDEDEFVNIIDVCWINTGKWSFPEGIGNKISQLSTLEEYKIATLNSIFPENVLDDEEDEEDDQDQQGNNTSYTENSFLDEVYMEKTDYDSIVQTLRLKKNIILQGAPGVGKTFVAKRLAYSMMGVRNVDRVLMIQFHQSYSYEDFIMGYRPTSMGFELKNGSFYNFCKKAEADGDNDYFFIIDEINRGNLSKIFGELFMLIEADKRGIGLQLLYSDEIFAVPKNVYIIGMMNTADRSLAILDYALRRRFAFVELKPGFSTTKFQDYVSKLNNQKFSDLITKVEELNKVIIADDSLGEGFCIGHSYFCNIQNGQMNDALLASIIEYELIPLLKEYWFDDPQKLSNWSGQLRSVVQ